MLGLIKQQAQAQQDPAPRSSQQGSPNYTSPHQPVRRLHRSKGRTDHTNAAHQGCIQRVRLVTRTPGDREDVQGLIRIGMKHGLGTHGCASSMYALSPAHLQIGKSITPFAGVPPVDRAPQLHSFTHLQAAADLQSYFATAAEE